MKYIFLKIIKVLSCIFVLLLLTIPISTLFENASENLRQSNDIQESELNNNDVIESDQEELQIEEKQVDEVVEEKKPIIENKKSTTSTNSNNSNTSNTNNETNVNTKQESTSTSSVSNNVEVHEEIPKQETNNNVNQYIGVPNPNDFYYSFHLGHIDRNYHNLDDCYVKASQVALLDTIDINNTTCYEVLDGQGTILGIYMGVNCNSGNCSRYKEMVGIITD